MSVRAGDVAIALYVFSSVVIEDGSTVAKLTRILLVAAAVFEATVKPITVNLVWLWQLLFISFAAASTSWAYSPDNAERMALTLLINGTCIVALVFLIVDDPLRLRLFLCCVMFAPSILMIRIASEHGLLVFLSSRDAGDTNANIVGMTAAFGFGLAHLSFTQRALISRWIAGVLVASNLIVAALSASRKAIIMVALIVVIFSIFNNRADGLRRLLKVLTAAGIGLLGYWTIMNFGPLYELVGHRMQTMLNGFLNSGEVDASTSTRLSLIERGVGWFYERPWFGHGADNFRALMANFYPDESAYYAHNNFVELLVNGGIAGCLLFYWMYAVIIGAGIKRRASLDATQSMILSLMLTLLFIEYGAIDYYNRILMAFVGVAWVALCTNTRAEAFPLDWKAASMDEPVKARRTGWARH